MLIMRLVLIMKMNIELIIDYENVNEVYTNCVVNAENENISNGNEENQNIDDTFDDDIPILNYDTSCVDNEN